MSEEIIDKAVNVLRAGGVILYPTDTIWGIGCDATNDEAVQKVFAIKQRDDSKSLIILLDQDSKLNRYIREIPEAAWDILDHVDKPTTLILDGAYNISEKVIAADGSVGVRICKQELCQKIIRKLNRPLVSTSANLSGTKAPASFHEVSDHIRSGVDYIVDVPRYYEATGKASSIIKLDKHSNVSIIRS